MSQSQPFHDLYDVWWFWTSDISLWAGLFSKTCKKYKSKCHQSVLLLDGWLKQNLKLAWKRELFTTCCLRTLVEMLKVLSVQIVLQMDARGCHSASAAITSSMEKRTSPKATPFKMRKTCVEDMVVTFLQFSNCNTLKYLK